MVPILLSVGPIHLYSLSIFIVCAWIVFSFTFWRAMREFATQEEKTFDLMFYGTIAALIGARVFFVVTHWSLFSETPLAIAALWVIPGLSLYGGLLAGIVTMLVIGRSLKVRIGSILDALSFSLATSLLVGKVGSLLGASEIGLPTNLPIAVFYAGYPEARHPVQGYEILVLLILSISTSVFITKSLKRRWPYGLVGVLFFLAYSISFFGLEFFKEGSLYWQGLSLNQWILLGLFCESIGALYIRGGGRQWTLRVFRSLYARISKRRSS